MNFPVRTSGVFENEELALSRLDELLNRSDSFRVYHEVPGFYVQPRPLTEEKESRIDRILIPLKKTVDAGWHHGAIGIEAKKSSHKIGPIISQALDYSRCVFELPTNPPGLLLMVSWVFIWPLKDPGCDLASVMAQNRIGYAYEFDETIYFCSSGLHGLVLQANGEVRAKNLPSGRRRGSR